MDISTTKASYFVRDENWAASHERHLRVATSTRKDLHIGDRTFAFLLRVGAVGLVALLASIGIFLVYGAWPSIERFGVSFFFTSTWDPVKEVFGSLPVIFGTLMSTFIALLIAAPISIGIGLFLNELAPKRLGRVIAFLVEMLAAIPSVVYGLWGIFVLAPWLRVDVQPFLKTTFGFLPFFQGPSYGVGMLAAGVILSIMIVPTISAICREVFRAIPRGQREAALALGATRWEMMRLSVLKSSRTGIVGAIILGTGRALGETMAVTMVIGNRAEIDWSIFAPSQTMASVIANEYAEATSSLHLAALMQVGLALFLVTFALNAIARLFVLRISRVEKS